MGSGTRRQRVTRVVEPSGSATGSSGTSSATWNPLKRSRRSGRDAFLPDGDFTVTVTKKSRAGSTASGSDSTVTPTPSRPRSATCAAFSAASGNATASTAVSRTPEANAENLNSEL